MKNCFFIRAISLPTPKTFFLSVLFLAFVNFSNAQTHKPITKNIDPLIQGFWEYLPEGYNASASKKYPLMIFFHGIGEIGNGSTASLQKVLKNGVPKLINEGKFPKKFTVGGKDYSFIVISPQIKKADRNPQMVKALIEYCKTHYQVDENKIYVTGLSQGGGTVWQLSTKGFYQQGKGFQYIANSLAAVVPICGNYPSSKESSTVLANAGVPVWIMHNDGDKTVNPQTSKDWYKNLIAAGIDPSTLITINHAGGHDAWTKGYDPNFKPNGKNVYEWMLQYTRKNSTTVGKDETVTTTPPPPSTPSNQNPTAVITTKTSVSFPVDTLVLDASASKDADGTIKSYSWKYLSGPTNYRLRGVKLSKLSVYNLKPGTYNLQLTVTDDKGAKDSSKVSIIVNANAGNIAPVASLNVPASVILPVDSTLLDASASYDTDGKITNYKWQLVSAPSGYSLATVNKSTVTLSKLIAGNYTVALTVTDNEGAKTLTQASFSVSTPTVANIAPVAIVKAPTTITLPLDSALMDGSSSYDKDGTIKQYSWQLISGPASYILNHTTGSTLSLNTLVPGTYSIQFIVKDNQGAQDVSVVNLVVNAKPIPSTTATRAIIKGGEDLTLPVNAITLDGTASTAAGNGKIKSYAWKFVSGPGGYAYSHPYSPTFKIWNLAPGTRTFQLTVKDDKGTTHTTEVTFTVSKQGNARVASNGPATTAADIAVSQPAKNSFNIKAGLTMAPVPAVTNMNVYLNDEAKGKVTIRISDASGRVVMLKSNLDKNETMWQHNLQVSQLISGLYYCEVIIANKKLNGKFVKVN